MAGGAFGKIVTSLVNDVLMPLLSILTGGINFSDLKIVLKAGDKSKEIAEVAFKYGAFIQNVIDFLIIAFCIFMMIWPISPADFLCMLAALTKMTFKKYMIIIVLCKPITLVIYTYGLTYIIDFFWQLFSK